MLQTMILKCTRMLRLTSRGGLFVSLLALTLLAACGTTSGSTGNSPTATTAPAATATTAPAATATTSTASATTVTIIGASGNYSFSPASVTIKVGQAVKWVNNTAVPHTSTSDSSSAVSWDSSTIDTGGASFSFTFTKAGTYAYHCSFHPFMHGTIVVTG